jgi:hypothetical protein
MHLIQKIKYGPIARTATIGKTGANQVEQQYMLQSISLAERMRQWDEFAEPYSAAYKVIP